jgi:hypothetical protein
MLPVNGLESNYKSIIKEFTNHLRIHEHDFISIRIEKEQTSTICSTCGSLYCEKCGKLVNDI